LFVPVLVFPMAGSDDEIEVVIPTQFYDCVSREDFDVICKSMEENMEETIHKFVHDAIIAMDLGKVLDRVERRIIELVDRVATLETCPLHHQQPPPPPPQPQQHPPQHQQPPSQAQDDAIFDARGNFDEAATRDARLRHRLCWNRAGMGDNLRGNNNRIPDDPFAKIKFTIPSFSGHYDAEAYLDWEMTVEQKFASHLIPEHHQVRQPTSEFKDFAIIWWTGLVGDGREPTTWDDLKDAMCDRFVPPSYHRELRKKLMRLDQGDKSFQDYYGELQKMLQRCKIVEATENAICRFYSGLRREI
jgi:hypothetical protein